MERRLKRRIIIFLIILLTGCAQLPEGSETQIPASPTIIAVVRPTVEASPTATIDVTRTIPNEATIVKIKNLLSNNGGCELPCIWGITPGVTTFDEAKANLYPIDATAYQISNTAIQIVSNDLTYPIENSFIHVGLQYHN
ncbi:MAG: hypothetical protein ABFD51_06380, partial [Anaerolineaceae bacterium]